jgi:hypothetical protein
MPPKLRRRQTLMRIQTVAMIWIMMVMARRVKSPGILLVLQPLVRPHRIAVVQIKTRALASLTPVADGSSELVVSASNTQTKKSAINLKNPVISNPIQAALDHLMVCGKGVALVVTIF